MKTGLLYLIVLLTACNTAKKVVLGGKKYDDKHRVDYEWFVTNNQEADTVFYTYFYNPDNTLEYRMRWVGQARFIGKHISRYYYHFDAPKQQVLVTGLFADPDIGIGKQLKTFNTRGQLLEIKSWVVGSTYLDTVSWARGIVPAYDVFDTAWANAGHAITSKMVFEYDKRGKLANVVCSQWHREIGEDAVDIWSASAEEYYAEYETNCPAGSFLNSCPDQEKEYTFTPYLKSLKLQGKLE